VLGSRKDEPRKTELADAAQTLHRRRVEESQDESLAYPDDVVDGVSDDLECGVLWHAPSPRDSSTGDDRS
jgi:hypothetical protein